MKKVFLIWAKETKHSQFLAKSLGAEFIVSYKKNYGSFRIPVFLRYIFQAIDTWKKLNAAKPDFIFVQNPPIFAALVVYYYGFFHKSRFAIDTHTAAFLDAKWKFFYPLHKFLARRATINSVHNYKNLEIVKKWNAPNAFVLQACNPQKEELLEKNITLPDYLEDKLKEKFSGRIFMVNRFASDDAYLEVIETAKIMPDYQFFITGDFSKIKKSLLDENLKNVLFTGYIPHPEFMLLMERSDVVLALTKRKDTVLWSIREIMALEKPFITTDSEVLRHYFKDVAIFTDHSPFDLKNKIETALNQQADFKTRISAFLEKDALRWNNDIDKILKIVEHV